MAPVLQSLSEGGWRRRIIRLVGKRKAKPTCPPQFQRRWNANTRTLPPSPGYGGTSRPDKCLVVKSLDSRLRPVFPSQHGIHRHHHQGVEGEKARPLLGYQSCFPLSRNGEKSDVAFTRSPPPREAAIFLAAAHRLAGRLRPSA